MPLEKAAATPLNYLTMHFALLRRARLEAGETVLVHGAAGGVGTAACQHRLTDGPGVDVVVDPVGGDRFPDSLGS